jgi:hypothetical protein
VHVVEIREREIGVAAERLEPAARVPRPVAQQPTPDRVGRAGGEALGHRIVALGALAGHEGEARGRGIGQQRGQQVRDFLGRVLPVAVERADERRAGGPHGIVDGGRLPRGAGMGDDGHRQVGMGGGEALQRRAGVIAGAVIGHADLEGPDRQGGGAAGLQQRHGGRPFVEHRNADGETRGRFGRWCRSGLLGLGARHACDTLHRPGRIAGPRFGAGLCRMRV